MMTIKQLKANLLKAICEGYADYKFWFIDENHSFSIDKVYMHEEDGIEIYTLESNETDNKEFSALELLAQIDKFDDDKPVVCLSKDDALGFTIDETLEDYDYNDLWWIDDDGDLCMGMTKVEA